MIMTFFAEHDGYYFDQNLMAESAGYVRNAFVLASLGEYAEYDHLENILNDAIYADPPDYNENSKSSAQDAEKYTKYQTGDYVPTKHEYIE